MALKNFVWISDKEEEEEEEEEDNQKTGNCQPFV